MAKTKIKGEDRLTRTMARGKAYINEIIKEQKAIVEAAEKRILQINKELEAFRFRLKPYTKNKVHDESYYDLKHQYEDLLVEKASLGRAITIALESIESAILHTIE